MPGLKASAAEAGAPDGFVDVVAQLQPIADGDDTPPHWDVTFATDDVEATAALASELGAEVLHGPVDAPWVRHAVTRDPQGAPSIARHSVPEHAPGCPTSLPAEHPTAAGSAPQAPPPGGPAQPATPPPP